MNCISSYTEVSCYAGHLTLESVPAFCLLKRASRGGRKKGIHKASFPIKS